MLLEFKAANYKSFKDELNFSLIPAPKQKGLDYSIFQERIGTRTYKSLCSAIIYGANASGKTNIIGAMDTFKAIVLRGNLRNDDDTSNPNTAANALELIPNNAQQEMRPVVFSIRFIIEKLVIAYSFSIELGKFLELDHPRKVLSEVLYINEELIFSRKDGIEFGEFKTIKDLMINAFTQNADSAIAIARSNLDECELFLMNGFKSMFSAKLVARISDWLTNQFIVIYRADSMHIMQRLSDTKKHSIYIEKTLNEAAKHFGINSNAIGYFVEGENQEAKLCSIFKEKGEGKAIPAEVFESYGTIRFINMFPLVVRVLATGGTLVVDEFDASIHPMALMNIINIFHNNEINTRRAQLIFNTHNPIFLNSNLYRRDEIKFVERDEQTHCSSHYSLSDFGTTGAVGVRKNEDYMKNYFIDRYGAIKDIDFTPIFEDLFLDEEEV